MEFENTDLEKAYYDSIATVVDTKLSFCSARYLYEKPGGEKFIFRVESLTQSLVVSVPSSCKTMQEALDWCKQPRARVVRG